MHTATKRPVVLLLSLGLALGALSAAAQSSDQASPRDLQRLQEDLANLQADLDGLEPHDAKADSFRSRAGEIKEEAIYLKVKMRHHQREGGEGTGVSEDEVADLRRAVADLRDEIDRSFGASAESEVHLDAGTEIQVRLDEGLSSGSARREDRFDASVDQPIREAGRIVVPAGTRLRGVVADVQPAERPAKGGKLELEFDRLYLDTRTLDIHGRVAAVGQRDTGDTAHKAGIGAVLGGVVGGILGGKKGALAGILLGGGGAVVATKGEEAELPAGTLLTVRLDQPLTIPRR